MTLNLKYFMYLSDYFPTEIRDIGTGSINKSFSYRFYNNISLVKINGQQLYIAKYFLCGTTNCKPGNDKDCRPEPRNIGVKYPWNHWGHYPGGGGYIFLLGDYNKTEPFTVVEREIDYHQVKSDRMIDDDIFKKDGDYRLFKNDDGTIYTYGGSFRDIYEIEFSKKGIVNLNKFHQGISLLDKDYTRTLEPYNPGINLPLVEYKIEDEYGYASHVHVLILDWFYSDGVYAFEKNGPRDEDLTLDKKFIAYRKKLIPYNTNNGFDGKGSFYSEKPEDIKKYGRNYGKLPMFSFGSNFIKLDTKKKIEGYKNVRISVAHSKIHSSEVKYPYNEKSNVHTFRKNIYNDMRTEYKDKYIEHYGSGKAPDCYGYIYLMYFILLLEKEDGSFDMKLGNSYLPLNLEDKHKDKYKFSLIFATGIQQENDDIIITAGEGDMYSILLKFSIDSIIEDCEHDVTNMNMNNYIFKIIGYKNGKSIVEDTLRKVVSGFDGLKGGRRYKLVKKDLYY